MNDIKPRGIPHQTDHIVITCMDHRYQRVIGQIIKKDYQVDIEASDRLAYAGASKAVADRTLIPNIQISQKLHDIKDVFIIDHIDCGGFGGLKAYQNDEQKEAEAHFESIAQAREVLHKILPQLEVIGLVVSLDGQVLKPAGG